MSGLRGRPLRGQREEIYGQAAQSERADLHTMMPARIVAFDPATQTATVKVLHVPRILGEERPIPDLPGVPVVFPRGGGGVLTWPIAAGDPGSLVFAERNIDAWHEDGEAHAAESNRMHDLSDAVFVPGGMVARPQAIEGFNNERPEFRSLDGMTTVQFDGDRVRACRGAYRFVANSHRQVVQLKVSPSDDPRQGGAAQMHFTLDLEAGQFKKSPHPIVDADDPNPED